MGLALGQKNVMLCTTPTRVPLPAAALAAVGQGREGSPAPEPRSHSDGGPGFLRGVHVSCGMLHTVVVCQDGTAMVAGSNDQGQLGTGDRLPRQGGWAGCSGCERQLSPCSSPLLFFLVRDTFQPVGPLRDRGVKVRNASAGYFHTLFVGDRGEVYACGAGAKQDEGLSAFPAYHGLQAKVGAACGPGGCL